MQPQSHGSTEKYNLSGGFQEENIEYYGVYGNISEEQTYVSDREETTQVWVKDTMNVPGLLLSLS